MENKKINDWNEDFEHEMLKRSKEFAEETVKTYTWEETKQAAIDRVTAKANINPL
jgi:hypothetical protein